MPPDMSNNPVVKQLAAILAPAAGGSRMSADAFEARLIQVLARVAEEAAAPSPKVPSKRKRQPRKK